MIALALLLALLSPAWADGPADLEMFGTGADGAFSWLPTGAAGTSCTAVSACPSQGVCIGVIPNCVLAFTLNSTIGTWDENALHSAVYEFTSFAINSSVQVGINYSPANGCSGTTRGGSTLWIKVQGDMDLGSGSTTAIALSGKGSCGGSVGTAGTTSATAGPNGCQTVILGGNGGAAGNNAGANGSKPRLTWLPGQPTPYNLWGAGGPSVNAAGMTICATGNVIATYGGSSGGSGGCAATSGSGCTSTTPGHGGGGLILDVGGNLKTGTRIIDTSGAPGTCGKNAGGAGGGSQLIRYRMCDAGITATSCTGTFTAAGAAGCGSASCTGCGAGGNGGDGVSVRVPIAYP